MVCQQGRARVARWNSHVLDPVLAATLRLVPSSGSFPKSRRKTRGEPKRPTSGPVGRFGLLIASA